MEIKGLLHRNGGTITAINGIGHDTDEQGRAFYYFTANVQWWDGGISTALRTAPFAIVIDDQGRDPKTGEAEYVKISDALADYLRAKGEWHPLEGGRGWTPYYPRGLVAIDGPAWVKVPTRYLAHYIDRGMPTPATRNYCPERTHNYIDASDNAIETLMADARQAATCEVPGLGLKQSAKALLRALIKQNVTTYMLTPGDTK